MNRKFKKSLKLAFDAPLPTKKEDFLDSFNYPKANRFEFLVVQASYIRKRVWILSIVLFLGILCTLYFYGLKYVPSHAAYTATIWIVSALLPFISLITVAEIAKSTSYNMIELEMSCKHNFLELMLIRMGILWTFQCVILLGILFSFVGKTDFNFFRLGLYLITPFLLNCYASLFVINRLQSRETLYICTGITGFISVLSIAFIPRIKDVFSQDYVRFWAVPFSILLVLSIIEIIKIIKRTEDLQWNSVLTA